MPTDPDDFAEDVLDLVERIPPGRVMSYGDIAEFLGRAGPRQVGRVLATWGGGVPWWRVIRADGTPAPGHERRALDHYREEGTPLRRGNGGRAAVRVDMSRARWNGLS
ncbi:MAG TPA: MGMT family protein [Streptosporangiaceae bacterium]|nr:MGMT family protein [Streptosporangiaceae bacterium]